MRDGTARRFWAKVDKRGPIHPVLGTRCWLRTGHTVGRPGQRYGQFSVDGGHVLAHRYAYQLLRRKPLGDLQVDHRCHNQQRVNPTHLRLATDKQNKENQHEARRDSKTGVRGVSRYRGKYQAQVRHNGRLIYVGTYTTIEQAAEAVRLKRIELFTHNDVDRLPA